jgi:hypothetical protein
MTMPPARRRRPGCLLPLAVVVLIVAGFAVYLGLQARAEKSHPPAAVPPDMCTAIGTDVFERLVPHGVPETGSTYSSGSDASCAYATTSDRSAGPDTYGFLRVRLLRYGQIGWTSGPDRASAALRDSCDDAAVAGQLHGASGLGDQSCAAYRDEGAGGTALGSAVFRRGADLFWVDYYTHPGTADHAAQAVAEVATAALAGIR